MKNLLSVTILFFLFTTGSAQVKIGGRIGFNLSTLTLEKSDLKDYRTMLPGVNGGIMMEFGKEVIFNPGILVSMQGLKVKDGNYKSMFRTTYLSLPLNAKIRIGKKEKRVSGYFTLGTYVAYWLGAKLVTVYPGRKVTEHYKFDNASDNRFDVGVSAGGGVNIDFGKSSLQVGPAFSMGLRDMAKFPYTGLQGEKPLLNTVLAVVNINYMFRVSKEKEEKPKPPVR